MIEDEHFEVLIGIGEAPGVLPALILFRSRQLGVTGYRVH